MRIIIVLVGLLAVFPLLSVACVLTPAPAPSPTQPAARPTSEPAPSTPPAQTTTSAAEFYKKNMVTLVVNSKAGGGTDLTGRLFATFWPEVTGGQMTVKNDDGGGGAAAINVMHNSAKPDGLTMGIAILGAHMVLPTLFKSPGVQFEFQKLSYIGETNPNPYAFLVGAKQPYQSMVDLQKVKGHVFGGDQPGGANTLHAVLTIELFGLKEARVATGFRGTDLELAVARGEITGYAPSLPFAAEDVAKGYAKPPFIVFDNKRWLDFFRDTPTIMELVKPTPQQENWLKLARSIGGGKVFYTSPGIPEEKLQFMRDAFGKVQKIPAFQDQIRAGGPWIEPTSGKEVMTRAKEAMSIPEEDLNALRQAVQKYITVK